MAAMDPSQGEGRGASELHTTGGQMTTTAGQGASLGIVPGDAAYSTTTVSTGVDPATGQPTTTYQTFTVGAVPTSSDDGMTAGYATYKTYTATTVGAPMDTTPAVGGCDVGVEDISGGGDVSGRSMGGGFDDGGNSQLASDIEMSGNIGAGMGGGMGTGGGADDVGGLAGGVMGRIGGGERDTGGMGGGI